MREKVFEPIGKNGEDQFHDFKIVFYKGKNRPLLDVTAELGLSHKLIKKRLDRGWTLEEALIIPVSEKRGLLEYELLWKYGYV